MVLKNKLSSIFNIVQSGLLPEQKLSALFINHQSKFQLISLAHD